jgi:hypothetical protein
MSYYNAAHQVLLVTRTSGKNSELSFQSSGQWTAAGHASSLGFESRWNPSSLLSFIIYWARPRQSFWLQIQRSGFDSRRYHIFWVVVGLERGPLSLVSTTEELLGRKSSGSCLENRDYGRRVPSRWPHGTHYPQKMALPSPTSGGPSDSGHGVFLYTGPR